MSRLAPLFTPQGIAVVGASRDPHKLGAVMLRSLQAFTGPVTGINPRDPDPAAGRFSSVAAAAEATGAPLDLAVLCVPASASARALTDAARGGARAALVCSGGYAEAGIAGAAFQRDLAAAAAEAGVALLGPNTSGFLVPARRLHASFVPGAASVPAGPVAVVAASGGVNHALAYLLAEAGLGVSLAVGLGNAVDVSTPDVLRYLADDEPTRAVALHVESVPDGPALVSAVRYLTARKPVAALVVGRSDVADFAQSHTGALATTWRVTRAALRQAGAVLVDDELELADAVAALSALRLPPAAMPTVGRGLGAGRPGAAARRRAPGPGHPRPGTDRGDPAAAGQPAAAADLPGQPGGHRAARASVRRGARRGRRRPGHRPGQRVRAGRAGRARPARGGGRAERGQPGRRPPGTGRGDWRAARRGHGPAGGPPRPGCAGPGQSPRA